MQRFPLGKYISVSVIIWGAVLSATAGTENAPGVLAVRFFLGGLEGAVTAGKSDSYVSSQSANSNLIVILSPTRFCLSHGAMVSFKRTSYAKCHLVLV